MVLLEQLSSGHGIPGQEGDDALLAPGESLFVATIGEGVAVLHTDDGNELLGLFDFSRRDFAEADVADLALLLHAAESAERLLERGGGDDSGELVELDAVELEAAEAHFDTLDHVAGAAYVLGLC